MSLYVIATPIGPYEDIGQRALDIIKNCPVIIAEERKEASKLLRFHNIKGKKYEVLNEHSQKKDIENLLLLCQKQEVALISDCGTPGFCDPGADLVALCRQKNVPIHSVPGPSALTCFLSLLGVKVDTFLFRGFLSVKKEDRQEQWKEIQSIHHPVILMDTPYRLQKMMTEVSSFMPQSRCILGLDLSQSNEKVIDGLGSNIKNQVDRTKAEFMLIIFPRSQN